MPNHIKNRLEITGTKEQVEAVIKKFSNTYPEEPNKSYSGDLVYISKDGVGWLNEETGVFTQKNKKDVQGVPKGFKQDFTEAWTRFPDFDKIIPCPESLHITSDGWVSPMDNQFSANTLLKAHLDEMRESFDKNPNRKKKTMKNFLQGVENYLNYGHATWYSWSIDNWGTKWNCYDCETIESNVFEFDTAWSGIPNMIDLMSKEFPEVKFLYEWSDEDTGSNCGIAMYLNGELDLDRLENGSKEAYDLAFKLRPDYKKDYELKDGKYEYIES